VTRYGTSPWLHWYPVRRRPVYPRFRGSLDVDVAIIGGGLAGVSAAYAFAVAGVPVALFEARRVGQGATAYAAGLVSQEPAASFESIAALRGLRAARRMAAVARRAGLEVAALLKRLRVRCDHRAVDTVRVALGAADAKALRRDFEARKAAGLDVSWLAASAIRREAGIVASGGLRMRGDSEIDPYRACLGLAAAAVARRAAVFEQSPVLGVRAGRKAVELRLSSGIVRARTVVVATGTPSLQHRQLRRHVKRMETYAALTSTVPSTVRRELGGRGPVLRDAAVPSHLVRWVGEDRLLVAGADQPALPARSHPKVLVQRTGQLMYELSLIRPAISGIAPEYGWHVPYGLTADTWPLVGPHRNYPRHLFALGFGPGAAGLAVAAGRMLVRHHRGEPTRDDLCFGLGRVSGY
jgi:glycine/D-amino acid oxidase-like deaminating enzyme